MNFKTTLLVSALAISMLHAQGTEQNVTASGAEANMTVKQEGIKYIKMLGGTLKGELQKHMKADKTGLEAANFCATRASSLTKEVNEKLPKYAKVRRTSLKIRNAKENAADATDIKVMNDYQEQISKKTFKPSNIVVLKEGNTTRVYKPLVVKAVCLKCHGENISKEINSTVAHAYPSDKAIGYKEGDLRGVIVSEIADHETASTKNSK